MENKISFKVCGKYALFTDPLTKIGGEKYSCQIPTYQALKGIVESIYWKPTIIWIVDKVRIMKAINSLAIYTYLCNVEYQIQAHFEWNVLRDDLAKDRNENKHYFVMKRRIERGGRRDIFLGARECQGYVEPCCFGQDDGEYDQLEEFPMGLMFHGFDYPDETGRNELRARFWNPVMRRGIIEFAQPKECIISRFVKRMSGQSPSSVGLNEEELLGDFSGEDA